uniref:F-box domain-containing protein n=2 Tax=Chenopodium quinoa TaxID=63459 RepID=A0A803KVD6_CHEQI
MLAVGFARKCIKTTTDRISNLPPNVTKQILECLPLQEAARMSILSSHWRQKWALISQLILDEGFFSNILKHRTETADISLAYSKAVNDILFSHVGPISKLVLYLPSWFPKEIDLCQWIRYVRANGVQDFTLVYDRDPEKNLPASLFSCVGLTHLTLCKLISLPPNFRGFPCLVSLSTSIATCVHSPSTSIDANVLETLISKCPQLQSLYLLIIDPQVNLSIRAPNLEDLYVEGLLSELCLKGDTVITKLTLDVDFDKPSLQNRHMSEIFTCLTNVEKLVLRERFWWRIRSYDSPKKFPSKLEQLRTLKLEGMTLHRQWTISLALSFFVSCPHLEQLYIKASKLHAVSDQPPSDKIEGSCILPCLKNVQLFGISGLTGELQLIKFLLAYSPLLEEMAIELSTTIGGAAEKFDFAKETVRYHRASTNVEVIINAK